MNYGWIVESKSDVHFRQPKPDNPDNQEKRKFQDYQGFTYGAGRRKWIPDLDYADKKNNMVSLQFVKVQLSRRCTVNNPEYHTITATGKV